MDKRNSTSTISKDVLLSCTNPNELKKIIHRISWTPYLNTQPMSIENGINLVDILSSQPKIAKERSREIDKILLQEKEEMSMHGWKVLLLGPASSGKSTLLRQMILIHCGGFSESERDIFKALIYTNIIQSMTKLVRGIEDLGMSSSEDASYIEKSKILGSFDDEGSKTPSDQIKEAVKCLWDLRIIKEAYNKHGDRLNIQETAAYFFNELERIWDPEYIPSDQDIVHTRKATDIVSETSIMVKKQRLRVFDVGGHRHLRLHWVPYFDDVKAVVFVVAISSYNQVMEEDGETNRMVDAIALFDQIVNDPAFKQTSIILLLNKMDLFEEKIKTVHVKDYFDTFDGAPCDSKAAQIFFRKRFERCALPKNLLPDPGNLARPSKKREIFTHFTTNTDTKLTRVIINFVTDIVMKQALSTVGIL